MAGPQARRRAIRRSASGTAATLNRKAHADLDRARELQELPEGDDPAWTLHPASRDERLGQEQTPRRVPLSPRHRSRLLAGRDPGREVRQNLSSVLQAISQDPKKRATLLEWIRALTPLDVVDLEFPQDFSGRVLVHLVEQGGRRISAYSASDGTLRFLAILAALLDTDSAHFYFFEEIENGIHPTRLHLLVQLIEQQCRTRDVQVIATTHSPQLLGFLSPESRASALLIYRLRGADESSVRKVVDLPDLNRVLETQDLARLHASGWLEDMVELMADDAGEAAQ
ncbi:ATP-binding protein [Sorangium sp. So ce1504]